MLIGVIAEELLTPLSVAPSRYIDGGIFANISGPDTFLQARIFQIGFVAPGLVDETAIFGNEVIYQTFVTNGYLGVFPDTFNDPDSFYDFIHSSVPVLAPPAIFDYDYIWSPTLVDTALKPGRVVDTDVFHGAVFRHGVAPDLFIETDIVRASVIRRDGDAIVLLLETFNDAETIFAASLARAVLPALVTDNDIFYASSQAAFVAPSAFSSSDTFFAPFVSNQLNPSLILADDVFIGPSLRTPGRMGLFVDDDIFFVSSVQFAPLLPLLVGSDDAFFPAVIASNPALYNLDPIIDFDDTFYAPVVFFAQQLAPHLWPDVDVNPPIAGVVLGQAIAPTVVFNDADIFYAPVLPQVLSPALYVPADTFFTPVLIFDQSLLPDWFIDTDVFFAPSMTALAGWDGTLATDGPIMPSSPQPTVILVEG